jgi:toxin CptA
MPHSTRWSSTSAPCRLEWRPSRWVIGAQLLLALLAPCAVLGSEMPRMAAWLLAGIACAYGLWLARREACKPPRQLLWPTGDAPVTLDGEPLQQAELHWRGPLAFLHWRGHGGRGGRLDWWPDTLPAAQRRELRLAARARATAQPAASMAP